MKAIKVYDELIASKSNQKLSDLGINGTLFWAYRNSKSCNNEFIDFNDVIWESDVEQIVSQCRKHAVDTITISSTFSGLTEVLWEMVQLGCKVEGMAKVNAPYKDFMEDTYTKIPAVVVKL